MQRTIAYVLLSGALLLGLFFAAFTGDARPRADYIWNNESEPQTLDPLRMSGQPEGSLAIALFEGLTSYDPDTLAPLPGVARDWEVSGLTFTFHLREDAYWVRGGEIFAPGGEPRRVTAEDFLWSFRARAWPEVGSEYAYLLHLIKGYARYEEEVAANWKAVTAKQKEREPSRRVTKPSDLDPDLRAEVEGFRKRRWDELVEAKAPDSRTLVLTLESAVPYFMWLTSFYGFYPVCREALEEHGDEWVLPQNIVTNGPYYLEEWRFNAYIRLRKNPHYWDTREHRLRRTAELRARGRLRAHERRELELLETFGSFEERGLETLEALAIEEENIALNLYLNGDVDRLRSVPNTVVAELIAASRDPQRPLLHVHHGPFAVVYFYNVNCTLPVFSSNPELGRKLRRALSLAIDRKSLVEVVTRGGQLPAYRLVVPGIPGYPSAPLFGSGSYEKDLAEAKRLVADVRAERGDIPPLKILYNTRESHEKIATFIQGIWQRELGLKIQLTNQEWGVYLDSRRTGNYDIARAGWIMDYPDPNTFLDMYVTGNPNNDPRWSNPLYDRIVKEYAMRITIHLEDPERRKRLLADLEGDALYRSAIRDRRREGGSTYGEELARRITAYEAAPPEERLERAYDVRLLLLEIAEEILMYDMPVIPIYFYTQTQLWPPELQGIYLNVMDVHPPRWFRWRDGVRPSRSRYAEFPRFAPAWNPASES